MRILRCAQDDPPVGRPDPARGPSPLGTSPKSMLDKKCSKSMVDSLAKRGKL